jgi:hypothetical protein
MTKEWHMIHRHGKQNPSGLGLCSTTGQQKEKIVLNNILTLIQVQCSHHYKSIIKMRGRTSKGGVCIAGAYRPFDFVHIGKEAWNYEKDA